jgi:DNA-binding transcriptional LysR family regulator
MLLNDAGTLYILSARESVRQAWLGVDRVHAFLRVQTNELRIGYSTHLNTKLLDIIRRIQPRGDESISVTREGLMTQQAVDGVLQGDLHVGFGVLPILEPELSARLLMEEPLVACLPLGHRLATRATIRPEELADEPMVSVMRKAVPGRHEDIAMHFESLGVSLRFVAAAFSLKEALWMVTQGMGISLMTRFSALSYRHEVVVRPLSDRLLTVKSGVFTRRDHIPKLVSDFVDLAWVETAILRAGHFHETT